MIEDYRKKGFTVHHYSMAEEPAVEMCVDVLQNLHSCLQKSRRTLVQWVSLGQIERYADWCCLCIRSCVDGLGRSCLVVALLALYINEDLSPFVAIELVRHARGAAAIQTIKVGVHLGIIFRECYKMWYHLFLSNTTVYWSSERIGQIMSYNNSIECKVELCEMYHFSPIRTVCVLGYFWYHVSH